MQIGFEVIPLIVALLALWIAFADYRRNNYVQLKLRECDYSYGSSVDENGGQCFLHFRVLMQSYGIPLHSVSVALVFGGKEGSGTFSFALERRGESQNAHDELAKGMIAEFFLKSYRLSEVDVKFLSNLESPSKQSARLNVYSNGYLAAQFKIGSLWDTCKGKWNHVAFWLNYRLQREIGKNREGIPIVRQYEICPTFNVLGVHLMRFLKALSRDLERGKALPNEGEKQ